MKILATSDIHGNKAMIYLIMQIIREEENISALIIAGDITPKGFYQLYRDGLKYEIRSVFGLKNKDYVLSGNERDIKTKLDLLGFVEVSKDSYNLSMIISKQMEQLKQICVLLKTAGIPIFMLIGNDDHISDKDWENTLDNYKIGNLNSQSHNLGKLKLIGFQYVLPTPWNTNNELSEEGLAKKLKGIEGVVDEKTVLITHSPAKNILDRLITGQNSGSESIRNLVKNKQPPFHVFGHIHEAFGSIKLNKTVCCNVSCLWNDWILRGYILDIDKETIKEFRKELSISELENICINRLLLQGDISERRLAGW